MQKRPKMWRLSQRETWPRSRASKARCENSASAVQAARGGRRWGSWRARPSQPRPPQPRARRCFSCWRDTEPHLWTGHPAGTDTVPSSRRLWHLQKSRSLERPALPTTRVWPEQTCCPPGGRCAAASRPDPAARSTATEPCLVTWVPGNDEGSGSTPCTLGLPVRRASQGCRALARVSSRMSGDWNSRSCRYTSRPWKQGCH